MKTMHKICGGLLSAGMLVSPVALAQDDSVFKFGLDYWWGQTKVNEIKRDDSNTPSFSLAYEHSAKYWPNVAFRYTTVDADFMAFDKSDLMFYYNLLTHDALHFDAGIAFTNYSNTKFVNGATGENVDFDKNTWNLFAKAEINVPNTNFDVIGAMEFSDRNDLKTTDLEAGIQYRIVFQQQRQLALKGGYRAIDIESRDFTVNAEDYGKEFIFVSGWFIGAEYQF
ncbi:TIGR04219 family outer membrane beta-barrel protein [Vibrio astriarenae]|uniref:TIGR04219 family outer membrane beta-barrel protein n=1 Tax=Vibrio astriarenae TaxID=1481923 RepID=A0A7Z2T4Y4_9VIBR|nr:TIGR04219 family outer membrane beta-barrel protein [Vibrio astriarenae]QIA64330.1 TIGR04219 family outer membrane beta-barrel protein [Vibrio astriarenae]